MLAFKTLVCSALLIGLFTSAEQEFKGVLYKVPAGWEEATEGEAKVFSPKGLKESEVLAIVLTAAVPATSESKKAQFEEAVGKANDGSKVVSAGEVTEKTSGTTTLLIQPQSLDTTGVGKNSRLYAMIFGGSEKSLLMVVTNSESLLVKYSDVIMEFVTNVQLKSAAGVVEPTSATGNIPTGNTPDSFMGTAGFLPSGQGMPIPPATVVGGKPQGLWWKSMTNSSGLLEPTIVMYIDSIRAPFPRLGGPKLFDFEGQKQQNGTTGLGTFTVSGGQMVEKFGGGENKGAFSNGSDSSGPFFKIGGTMFRPLELLTPKSILGRWTGSVSQYEFSADGTYRVGAIGYGSDWTATNAVAGKFVLDGYLLMLAPTNGPPVIDRVGMGGLMMIKGSRFFVRGK